MARRWRSIVAWWVGLAGAAALAPALAASLCPEGGPIRFAHYEFGLLYSADTGTGIDDDVQKELQRRSGCTFVVSLAPRARAWADLRSGDLDMLGSGVQTPQRDAFAWFAHYVVEDNHVLLSERVPAEVQGWADFERVPTLRLGVVRSFSFSPNYAAAVARLKRAGRVDEVGDTATLFRMFQQGRFDAFIASPYLSRHYLRQLKMPTPRRIEDWDPDPATPSGLALSRQRFTPEQARAWQALVQGMLDDGTVLRIVTRHMGAAGAPAMVYRP